MSDTLTAGKPAAGAAKTSGVDFKLEVVVIPVSDVDRAKTFYGDLGWRLDADFVNGDSFRVVQFTPPGSPASIHFGKGLTTAAPGSAQLLYLVVSDIEAARAELIARGAGVSEIFHRTAVGGAAVGGVDPERRTYNSFATFSDPDGNSWLLRRSPRGCRGASTRGTHLARVNSRTLTRAATAHGEHEKRNGVSGRAMAGLVRIHGRRASRQIAAAIVTARGSSLPRYVRSVPAARIRASNSGLQRLYLRKSQTEEMQSIASERAVLAGGCFWGIG